MSTSNFFPSIFPVTSHTDHVGAGSTFVAVRGMKEDGIHYISIALQKGATKIIVDANAHIPDTVLQEIAKAKAQLERVNNARQALALLSAQSHDYPAKKLKIIAITGTKGKSTTTFLVEHIFRSAGYKTALLSTVFNRILDQDYPTHLTTQQPDYIHMFLRLCVDQQVEWVIMEVAAQAFTLHRVEGIEFEVAIFTNFSQEHAEFYSSYDEYFAAKKQILLHLKHEAPLLINYDDGRVMTLAEQYKNTITYGFNGNVRYNAECISDSLHGLSLRVHVNHEKIEVQSALAGTFNGYNIIAATACAHACGISLAEIQRAVPLFKQVPGRLNKYVLSNGAAAFIDYAHNPSSYEAVLSTLCHYTNDLIVVFGCGGERDPLKRPVMGSIADRYAQRIILTSDNPRSEEPKRIVEDIVVGIPNKDKVSIELDRKSAIELAYRYSSPKSIIVLLGKGPDEYQIIQGTKYYFSEREILLRL